MSAVQVSRCLSEFAKGMRTLDALESCLGRRVQLRFWDTNERDTGLLTPLPSVLFNRADVDAQLRRYLEGGISGRELSDWAAAIRLLGCFDLEEDEAASSQIWDLLDELMSPDAWGPIDIDSILDLRRRLLAI